MDMHGMSIPGVGMGGNAPGEAGLLLKREVAACSKLDRSRIRDQDVFREADLSVHVYGQCMSRQFGINRHLEIDRHRLFEVKRPV